MLVRHFIKLFSLVVLLPTLAFAQTNTQITANYFNKIKNKPENLVMFLNRMPKGGELHYHLDGGVYAENLLKYSFHEGFCINPKTLGAYKNPNCPDKYKPINVVKNYNLYMKIINAWSMHDAPVNLIPGETHFFATFPKYIPLIAENTAKVLAGEVNRAAREHEEYMEIMIDPSELNVKTADGKTAKDYGNEVKFTKNFTKLKQEIEAKGINNFINLIPPKVKALTKNMRALQQCGTKNAKPGCYVTVRYLYLGFRNQPPAAFFAQLLTAFEVAKRVPSVVGINIVMQENGYTSMTDYNLQMQMIGYLHKHYPNIHITLHAGELAPGEVPPKGLGFHVSEAINIAHAQRIGHGIDLPYEKNPIQLLREAAKKQIAFEINLTSNLDTMGVKGKYSPLPLFLQYQVPVVLSTDDEGVERTDLTQQYLQAVLNYHFSYYTIKQIARNSITYSFLPGRSLWKNAEKDIPVNACQADVLGSNNVDHACQVFLMHNEKARMQWKLEKQFNQFEKYIAGLTANQTQG